MKPKTNRKGGNTASLSREEFLHNLLSQVSQALSLYDTSSPPDILVMPHEEAMPLIIPSIPLSPQDRIFINILKYFSLNAIYSLSDVSAKYGFLPNALNHYISDPQWRDTILQAIQLRSFHAKTLIATRDKRLSASLLSEITRDPADQLFSLSASSAYSQAARTQKEYEEYEYEE